MRVLLLVPLLFVASVATNARAERGRHLAHPCGFEDEGIVAAIRPRLTAVRIAYERRLVATPTLSGRVVAELTFDDGLTLRGVRVTENTTGSSAFGEDVIAVLRGITWPRQRLSCGPVRVSFPFVFAPEE